MVVITEVCCLSQPINLTLSPCPHVIPPQSEKKLPTPQSRRCHLKGALGGRLLFGILSFFESLPPLHVEAVALLLLLLLLLFEQIWRLKQPGIIWVAFFIRTADERS